MPIYNFGSNGSPIRRRPIYWFDGNGTPHEIEWGYWFDGAGTPHLVYGSGADWLYKGGNYNINPPGEEYNTDYITGIDGANKDGVYVSNPIINGTTTLPSQYFYSSTITAVSIGNTVDPDKSNAKDFSFLPSSTINTIGIKSIKFSGMEIIYGSVHGGLTVDGYIGLRINDNDVELCRKIQQFSGDTVYTYAYTYEYTWINTNNVHSVNFSLHQTIRQLLSGADGNSSVMNMFTSITCNNQS